MARAPTTPTPTSALVPQNCFGCSLPDLCIDTLGQLCRSAMALKLYFAWRLGQEISPTYCSAPQRATLKHPPLGGTCHTLAPQAVSRHMLILNSKATLVLFDLRTVSSLARVALIFSVSRSLPMLMVACMSKPIGDRRRGSGQDSKKETIKI